MDILSLKRESAFEQDPRDRGRSSLLAMFPGCSGEYSGDRASATTPQYKLALVLECGQVPPPENLIS